MKNLYTLISTLFAVIILQAQNPDSSIEWQKTIGANNSDTVYALETTTDGGYILGGYSNSGISGDKTENSRGALDIWIVKTDANGNILWDKTYGGSGDDYLTSLRKTADGGYIIGSSSNSSISGDKTENSRGGMDYWVIKLDADGDIQWQKTYGGAQPDFDTHIFQTADGGYFVSGYSDSNVSGDKTAPTKGQRDYWVLKLDELGVIDWQKSIGGSTLDRLIMSIQTQDNGYLLGGYSTSNISGDKSENSRGLNDNWIVKLDEDGNIEWDKTYGGSDHDLVRDVIQTADGNYIVGGYSHSGISGDKTEELRGLIDYWVYKLDTNGNMIWQKTIGGSENDYLRTVREKPDGTLLVTGYSYSSTSGDKIHDSNGGYDMWFVLLDDDGSILGQNTIGGSGDESAGYAIVLDDGYIFAVSSTSNTSGDKADNSYGSDDFWLFKTNSTLLNIEKTPQNQSFAIYPNPALDEFTVDFGTNNGTYQIAVTDISGKTIYKNTHTNILKAAIKLNAQSGVYIITVSTENGNTITKKLLKL